MTIFKNKERILKAARKKQEVTYKGSLIRLIADYSTETTSYRGMTRNIPSNEKQMSVPKTAVPSEVLI